MNEIICITQQQLSDRALILSIIFWVTIGIVFIIGLYLGNKLKTHKISKRKISKEIN